MNEIYQLQLHRHSHTKPYYIAKWVPIGKETGFWQQISPNYMYKAGALNFAKRKNLKLEGSKPT